MRSFTVQVDDWVKASIARQEAVVKQSSSELIEEMQTPVAKGGNMPVDTSFLRNSLVVTFNAPSADVSFNTTGTGGAPSAWAMQIASFNAGDVLYGTYTANYAGFVYYGVNGRAGRPWIDLAAQKWPGIVNSVVSRLRSQA